MSNKKKGESRDEVEELLRAAEEEILLKLSVDSHMSRVSPSYIDPDLQRRFQDLKNPSSSSSSSVAPTKRETTIAATEKKTEERDTQCFKSSQENDELNSVLGDDLFARFAALKASISSLPPKTSDGCNQFNKPNDNGDDNEDEDDEVEKVIQWAIDAARLDPSSPTDDDDDDDDEKDEDSNDDSDYDGDRVDGDKRVKGK